MLLIEHNERVGRKIEISGGGRCNFTNVGAGPENYLSANPDFCKSALARYTPWDFIALVEKHRIRYHEKTLGQQFCDGSSRQIIDLLLSECAAVGVDIRCGLRVDHVERIDRFRLATTRGVFEGESLVVATGGLSFAKLGATEFGYRLARQFGLRITALRPGLVPLTFSPEHRGLAELSGVSLPVITHRDGTHFREAMLVTHRGLSGPAILQISNYWNEGDSVVIDLMPDVDAVNVLAEAKAARRELAAVLGRHWPRRWMETWCAAEAPTRPLAHCKDAEIEAFARRLKRWRFSPAGTEGYPKAEVTLGGVDTTELSSKTMEARKVPGLFFIGEVVDVTGWLGGYNFQWAWASGQAAGRVA